MPVGLVLQISLERGEGRQTRDRELRQRQIAQDHHPFRAVRRDKPQSGDGLKRAAFPRLGKDGLGARVRMSAHGGILRRAIPHEDRRLVSGSGPDSCGAIGKASSGEHGARRSLDVNHAGLEAPDDNDGCITS